MQSDRLRSIVPMFGGATQYVDTLDAILAFVTQHQPTTDELVGWHRGSFANVSSRESIIRRVTYLQQAGFLDHRSNHWVLGDAGREYIEQGDTETLLRIMCTRNVGLRSLLYALSAAPMTIEEVSEQQLDTHPDLGWSRGQTDMAKQRVNWLRSMGLVTRSDGTYALTETGGQFVDDAVEQWTGERLSPAESEQSYANAYVTAGTTRGLDHEFRATVLAQQERTCPISGVDHPGLLDVAHILSWSNHPEYRADLGNVIALSKTHHAAFDRGFFTLDTEFHVRVNPEFETESDLLQRTLIDRAGEQIEPIAAHVDPAHIEQHNTTLAWM